MNSPTAEPIERRLRAEARSNKGAAVHFSPVSISRASSKMERRKIRVLLLETRALDAESTIHELRRAGFEPESYRVETEKQFMARLDPSIDVILADYELPKFDALTALRRVQQSNLDIPLLIISDVCGDELATQCMRHGVTDYLLKDRLDRLGLAVSKALDEKRLRAEAKSIAQELRQAQKMESLGQLAGGIAHDFNNLLTVISGRVWLLLEHGAFTPETNAALKEVQLAGERAANLTRQLLFFSRKHAVELRSLDVNATINETTAILRRLIAEHIDIALELDPRLPPVEGDAGMLAQVVINLAVNARDAMPRGGRLRITTRAVTRTKEQLPRNSEGRPGTFACMSVSDSGSGISPEDLPKIFEPFFTTKEPGKGTGIGLATVNSIVQQHHGWIEVESQAGAGTTFSVYVPLALVPLMATGSMKNPDQLVKGGSETVLVVEDDVPVREFAAAALRLYGYRVFEAGSGGEALELWEQQAPRIDLLLTDMILPGDLSGRELAARLRSQKPEMEVLFTSGYRLDGTATPFTSPETTRFIHKPFRPRALALAVREALDAREPTSHAGRKPDAIP